MTAEQCALYLREGPEQPYSLAQVFDDEAEAMARGKDAAYRDLDRLWGDTILLAVAGEPPARVVCDRYGRPADAPGRRVQLDWSLEGGEERRLALCAPGVWWCGLSDLRGVPSTGMILT